MSGRRATVPSGNCVKISPEDPSRFEIAGQEAFYFAGANCYYLLTRGADPALRHETTHVLDEAAAAGLTVVRCWAFADGALQPAPGLFDERVFCSLDWLLAEAAARSLRLLLVLTNYWKDYGGMRQYVSWAAERRGEQPPRSGDGQVAAEPFYTDPDCLSMFRAYMSALVHRVNSQTGVMYREDPTILAWSLANEPRFSADAGCGPGTGVLSRWAGAMAGFLKSIDANHLVTLDVEGFLGPSTPEACRFNPYECFPTGCDFAADCGAPGIDFASCHLYPDHWRPGRGEQDHLAWSLAWLDCHADLSRRVLRMPLVLSEFGKQRKAAAGEGAGRRSEWYSRVLARVLRLMRDGRMAGSAFWMLAAPSYPDHDGFTVRNVAAHGGGATANAIRRHASEVAALNGRPEGLGADRAWVPNPLPASTGSAVRGSSVEGAGRSCCPVM